MNYGATDSISYTHAEHARRCTQAAHRRILLGQTFVQVKSGQVVYCGRILSAWDHDQAGEMWKLELTSPQRGIRSFPARRSRLCSGIDHRCVCEGVCGQAGGERSAATDAAGQAVGGLTC